MGIRTGLAAICLTLLVSCSSNPLSFLTGGGPKVAANVQAGQENSQTVGSSSSVEQVVESDSVRDVKQSNDKIAVKSDSVDEITVNQTSPLVIILLVLGWLFPSPGEIARSIRKLWE